MKLFYKKDYFRGLEQFNILKESYNSLNEKLKELKKDNIALNKKITKNAKVVSEYELQIKFLKEEVEKTESVLKEKNEIIENLEKQIEDLKSDRYLIKKINEGRTKNTQKLGIKPSVASKSNVLKYLKGE